MLNIMPTMLGQTTIHLMQLKSIAKGIDIAIAVLVFIENVLAFLFGLKTSNSFPKHLPHKTTKYQPHSDYSCASKVSKISSSLNNSL